MSLLKTHWLILAAAGTLAVVVPYQLLRGAREPKPVPVDLATTPLAFGPVSGFDAVFSNPLFSPDRAPAGATDPTLALAAGPAPSPPAPPPRLVGIALGTRGKAVALVKQADGQTVTLRTGDTADGWRLIGIARSSARFRLGSDTQTLTLDFSNKASAIATAASAVIPLPPLASSTTPLALSKGEGSLPSDPTGQYR